MKLKSVNGSIAAAVALAAFAFAAVPAQATLSASKQKAAEKAGHDAYLYGYAPVYMNTSIGRFPTNNLINVRYLATDQTRAIVKPNSDTLYTIAVLDVGSEPIIVHTPATGSRYFSLELLDSYTNVIGYMPCVNGKASQTTTCPKNSVGNTAGDYAIVGPKWSQSTQPLGKTVKKIIKSPTPKLWIIGRTFINGQSDLSNVLSLQDAITMQLNSKVGTSTYLGCINSIQPSQLPVPGCLGQTPASISTPPAFPEPGAQFFRDLGAVTQLQPPLSQDRTLMTALRRYGIGPGMKPSDTQSADVMAALIKGAQTADAEITSGLITAKNASLVKNNGWILFDGIGSYGKNYLTRAIIAKFGLGANMPQEAVYPAAVSDYLGNPLSGAGGAVYKIHFAAGQLPKTSGGFWSIALYAADQFFVANPLNRFSVGGVSGLAPNVDGSTDVYISATQPGDSQHGATNWLPSPAGEFNLILRIYRPTTGVLDGTWKYPRIEKVS
jgi:hypothetical protein